MIYEGDTIHQQSYRSACKKTPIETKILRNSVTVRRYHTSQSIHDQQNKSVEGAYRALNCCAANLYCELLLRVTAVNYCSNLTLNGEQIAVVKNIKFIGLTIDNSLTWMSH